MSRLHELVLRCLSAELASHGSTPATRTASAGSTSSAVCAALTQADDYWNDSVVRWLTGNNAGRRSVVDDFVAATDTLTLREPLPSAVQNGDTFQLLRGGLYASSIACNGLTASELVRLDCFAVAAVADLCGEGNGQLQFDASAQTLTWSAPRRSHGAPVAVAGLTNGQQVVLYSGGGSAEDDSRFLVLQRTAEALPLADVTEDVALDLQLNAVLPRVTGDRAAAGSTIYWPVAVQNNAAGEVADVAVYVASPFPGAAAATVAAALGTGAGTLTADSFEGWGSSGWVWNETKGDCRYYYDRSGDAALVANPAGGMRGQTAVAWEVGDVLRPMPWFDIGLDAPAGGNAFENPANVTSAPSGVSFSCPTEEADALLVGDMAAGAVHTVWLRLQVVAGSRPVEGGRADLRIVAYVTDPS